MKRVRNTAIQVAGSPIPPLAALALPRKPSHRAGVSPLVQNLLVAALIVGALAFLILRQLRKPKDGCGGGCGCSAAKKTPGS